MEKDVDIAHLVEALRAGRIDATEFDRQLEEVVDEAGRSARESATADLTTLERIDSAARKASRL